MAHDDYGAEQFGQAIGSLFSAFHAAGARRKAARQQEAAERKARKEAELRGAAAERQRQAWLRQVETQRAQGWAGDLSQQDALAALKSKGGRRNPLDDQWV